VVALNEGLRRKKALWRPAGRNELESLVLAPWTSRRRQDLLDLLDQLTPKIEELSWHQHTCYGHLHGQVAFGAGLGWVG